MGIKFGWVDKVLSKIVVKEIIMLLFVKPNIKKLDRRVAPREVKR